MTCDSLFRTRDNRLIAADSQPEGGHLSLVDLRTGTVTQTLSLQGHFASPAHEKTDCWSYGLLDKDGGASPRIVAVSSAGHVCQTTANFTALLPGSKLVTGPAEPVRLTATDGQQLVSVCQADGLVHVLDSQMDTVFQHQGMAI